MDLWILNHQVEGVLVERETCWLPSGGRNVLGARKKLFSLEMNVLRSLIITFDCFSKCLRQQNILSAVRGGWVAASLAWSWVRVSTSEPVAKSLFQASSREHLRMNSVENLPKASVEIRNWKVLRNLCGIRLLRLCFPTPPAEFPPEAIYFAITQNLFTLSNINSVAQNRRHRACVEEKSSFLVHAKLPSVENLDKDYSGLFSRLSPPSQFFSKRNSHQARVANFSPESG